MNDFVVYEQQGRVVTLTLNNPDQRNAIGTQQDCDDIVAALKRADADASVSVVILTGAGSAFCSGGNVKHMLDGTGIGRQQNPAATRAHYKRAIQSIPRTLWEMEVPTIAAVNGAAIGAGCDLAGACDMRIAADSARFATSFIKLGLVPGDGGAWLMPRLVGVAKAAEMAFTGDMLDAQQALQYGLVSQVVPSGQLLEAANTLATRIAANPPQALRLTKRLLRESQHLRLPEMLELSAAFQALVHESEDHSEAISAFLEKRTPSYRGV